MAKRDHEDWVISEFLKHMNKSGIQISLVEIPEAIPESQKTFKCLTTDALLCIDIESNKKYFSADVMALTLPEENSNYGILAYKTQQLLVDLKLTLTFRSFQFIDKSRLREAYAFISHAVTSKPHGGQATLDNFFEITWSVDRSIDDAKRFILDQGILKSGTGIIWKQIRDENSKPLTKKTSLGGQADKSVSEGIPYILLLDLIGDDSIRQGTHFLGQFPSTYAQGILEAIGDNIIRVGAIFLFMKSESWELLYISDPLKDFFVS